MIPGENQSILTVMKQVPIYLASASPRRREILKGMGISFRVVPSRYRERKIRAACPEEICLRHAAGKAERALAPRNARFILAADTIVFCDGHVLGKPKTRREAAGMLKKLSGRWHSVFTGIALLDKKNHRICMEATETRVYVKPLSKARIAEYTGKVHTFDKAGAYAIQEKPEIVGKIRGSYSNVVGLPADSVKDLLSRIRTGK